MPKVPPAYTEGGPTGAQKLAARCALFSGLHPLNTKPTIGSESRFVLEEFQFGRGIPPRAPCGGVAELE